MFFMTLAGMNFATHFLALRRPQPRIPTRAIPRRPGTCW